jgi:uncharacterized membrane protein
MLHAAHEITSGMLWANLHLLFWMSLIPFTTSWMGENHFAVLPTALYGSVLLLNGIAYTILQRLIIAYEGPKSTLKKAIGTDLKGKSSILLYLIAIPTAFYWQWISLGIYVFVACMWLIPDQRIEKILRAKNI